MVHVYYGNGKGKTTAAFGLAVRSAGHGNSVMIVQFLKNSPTGEEETIAKIPNITLLRGKSGGFKMNEQQKAETKEIHNRNLKEACDAVFGGKCSLLVLDEGMDALRKGLLDESMLRELLACPDIELVITGHQPVEWLLEEADYVTEMVKRKHPFDKGVTAREGVEY
jgi:ATP:corrinoid adenosyltransferase